MKRAALAAIVIAALPVVARADGASEIRIGQDGVFSAKNIIVMQKAGSTLFTRGVWGTSFLRINVLTGESTVITKNHGESMAASVLKEGDVIDVEGSLVLNTEGITINATKLRDVAQNIELKTISGTITSIDTSNPSFMLKNTAYGSTRVLVSGASMTKGARTVSIGELAKSDVVLSASGNYDYDANVLTASSVTVFQPQEKFTLKNLQGTVRSVDAANQRLTIAVGAAEYTIHFGTSTKLLTKSRAALLIARMVVGDTVRVYGSIGDQHPREMNAQIVRDMSF